MKYKTALVCPICLEGTIKRKQIEEKFDLPIHKSEYILKTTHTMPRCTKCNTGFTLCVEEDLTINMIPEDYYGDLCLR